MTEVRIHVVNSGEVAVVRVSYHGSARIDGVPGGHAAVPLMFAGSV